MKLIEINQEEKALLIKLLEDYIKNIPNEKFEKEDSTIEKGRKSSNLNELNKASNLLTKVI